MGQHHLGPRYLDRNGGYTRVLKLQKRRPGDAAPRAVIEYAPAASLRCCAPSRARGGEGGGVWPFAFV